MAWFLFLLKELEDNVTKLYKKAGWNILFKTIE